jgi:hypothetical protein
MDLGLLGQFVVNGLMLGMMYALVAVGFTLFFGVLDVIKFSHGAVLTMGAFAGLSTWLGLVAIGVGEHHPHDVGGEIDPNRAAGEAQMPHRVQRKALSGRRNLLPGSGLEALEND